MKIHHFIAPARVGGAERVVEALASGLAGRGHDVAVCPVVSGDPSEHPFVRGLIGAGFDVRPIRVHARDYLGEWREASRMMEEGAPDVVHTHGTRSDLVEGIAAMGLDAPVVSTVHGFTDATWKLRMYRKMQEWIYRRFDAVVAVSRPLAERLEESGVPRARLRVVPNAWDGDDDLLDPGTARRGLGVDPGPFHVGWVGRLGPEKGGDVFLRALARLEGVPFVASIIGAGAEQEELRTLARELGVGGRIRWHGEVPEARRIFPGFDAFVMSSRREGTPMVLLEAVAARVPVVATEVGGIPDVVSDDQALLVPPEDPSALAEAIRRIRDGPAAARARADRAFDRLRTERSAEAWLRGYEAVYRSVLGDDRASGTFKTTRRNPSTATRRRNTV